jgi:hypothetical protein
LYGASEDPKKNIDNLCEAENLQAVMKTLMPPSELLEPEEQEWIIEKSAQLISGLIGVLNGRDPLVLADAFGIPRDLIEGSLGLAKGDIEAVVPLAKRLGDFNEEDVEELRKTLKSLQSLMGVDDKNSGNSGLNLQGMTREEIFAMADNDNSGALDFDEFKELIKFFGMTLSDQACLEMFASADKSGTGVLSYSEFEDAMDAIQSKLGGGALSELGVSTPQIAAIVLMGLIMLGAVLMFLFMGISAFTTGSAFGAVINSAAVLGGGGGSGGEDADPEKIQQQIEEKIQSVMDRMSDAV